MRAFIVVLLLIELLDEFVFGSREAAWPLIRDDLGLSYVQVGVLLSIPPMLGNLFEPMIGVLGDVWRRKALILGGAAVFALALVLTAASQTFALILVAFILVNPASGAFVSLSQATLMDTDPARHQQNMARWTFSGSVGVVLGALALGAAASTGVGWRPLFIGSAAAAVVLAFSTRSLPLGGGSTSDREELTLSVLKHGLLEAGRALIRTSVLRWLVLLEFSDLMLDGLHGYLALYFVDVVGAAETQAALGVALWTGVGLAGDLLLIPLLERVRGLTYLRFSVLAELVLFPVFLLVPGLGAKLAVVAVLGFANAGWYSVLQGQLYSAMPGQIGTVMAVKNVSGVVGSLAPLGIGVAARVWGLGPAFWLLLAGPVGLLIGLPRGSGNLVPGDEEG
jgi:FSR family fosmidomycin resistance protein-like MFS transporter